MSGVREEASAELPTDDEAVAPGDQAIFQECEDRTVRTLVVVTDHKAARTERPGNRPRRLRRATSRNRVMERQASIKQSV